MATLIRSGPARRAVVVGVCVVLAMVVLAAVVWSRVGRSQPQPAPALEDAEVLVTAVEFQQTDPSYTVVTVVAVMQGDEAFLRVRLMWSDDDGLELHQVPLLGATVTLREPYAGLTAACGPRGTMPPPKIAGPVTLELPCTGLLVPSDIATVELTD